MVTKEIVNNFLTKTLGIVDWEAKSNGSSEDKLELLKKIVIAHGLKISFQNVTWGSIPKQHRQIPTVAEAIRLGITGKGAMCIHTNFFLKLILDHLGYDTFVSGGTAPAHPFERNHMMLLVRFPSEGGNSENLYMVDVGFGGRPFLEPINLNKLPKLETAAGFSSEWRYNEEKKVYERFIQNGCPIIGHVFEGKEVNGWVDLYFDLEPLNFEDFTELYENVYSPRGTSGMLDIIFACRLKEVRTIDDYDYVGVRNLTIFEGTKYTYKETHFDSYEAILPVIMKHFPEMQVEELKSAMFNCEQITKEKLRKKEQEETN